MNAEGAIPSPYRVVACRAHPAYVEDMMAPSNNIPKAYRLRLSEVYTSIQGESLHAGKLCVFIRLTGCNLRCTWCDSAFTFTGGEHRDWREIAAEVHALGIHTVELTGGEPLVHANAIPLLQRLVDLGHEVLLETSGSRDIADVPDAVHVICDFKPPDSGEVESNLWANVEHLDGRDEVKFVLASRADYDWAVEKTAEYALVERVAAVQFSPVWGSLDPADLAAWLVEDRLQVRMQLQLHKVIWDPDARGV